VLAEDASYRVRLEGRAELLEKTRLRYRALKDMLGSLTWRRRLRKNEVLLREVIASQPRVDEALSLVEKKAALEGWLDGSQVLALAREVDTLKNSVWRQMGKKLKASAGPTFSERLTQLERLAVAAPRRVYPGERWKAALEALPAWLPELKALEEFGELLEALFKRPYLASQRLPYTPGELERLAGLWAAGDAALTSCWARISTVDTTDGVARLLRKRSRRAPMKPPRSGPELMLRAEFWRTLALSKLKEIASSFVTPVQLSDAEVLSVVRWLADRERGITAPLLGLEPARAGIIELSAELALAGRRPGKDPTFWERLYEQAQRADRSFEGSDDFRRLKDNVRLALQIASSRKPLDAPRHIRPVPSTLAGMVTEMRSRLLEGLK
jgi:hypothetical protein